LPIPITLSAFTLVLPAVAALALIHIQRHDNANATPRWFSLTILLLIYEAALATLSGTYIGPANSLRCGLDERWRNLYHNKDGNAVRRIQDAFQCCGLHSAWYGVAFSWWWHWAGCVQR